VCFWCTVLGSMGGCLGGWFSRGNGGQESRKGASAVGLVSAGVCHVIGWGGGSQGSTHAGGWQWVV